ncbi:hypothetical protein [Tsukamurella paurometabola]|uniref:Phage protein n=1 Tax=Tsukamurella paurometabola TaxID=2061 RepID=A0ABS5NDT8_TSUPA|nr:hypothetical protein [Tsukamurella paurometabola]MBS4102429.1 hypothetical protein [Tsukamurella paurometabola]
MKRDIEFKLALSDTDLEEYNTSAEWFRNLEVGDRIQLIQGGVSRDKTVVSVDDSSFTLIDTWAYEEGYW